MFARRPRREAGRRGPPEDTSRSRATRTPADADSGRTSDETTEFRLNDSAYISPRRLPARAHDKCHTRPHRDRIRSNAHHELRDDSRAYAHAARIPALRSPAPARNRGRFLLHAAATDVAATSPAG